MKKIIKRIMEMDTDELMNLIIAVLLLFVAISLLFVAALIIYFILDAVHKLFMSESCMVVEIIANSFPAVDVMATRLFSPELIFKAIKNRCAIKYMNTSKIDVRDISNTFK